MPLLLLLILSNPAAPQSDQQPLFAVVLPFGSDNPQTAQRFADSLRLTWSRHAPQPPLGRPTFVLSAVETDQIWPPNAPPDPQTDPATIADRLRDAAVHLAVWGKVTTAPFGPTVRVRAAELLPEPNLLLDKTFHAEGERAIPLLCTQIVPLLTHHPLPAPTTAEAGPEPPPGAVVNRNPGFEQGNADHPTGWDRIDGLTTLCVDDPTGASPGRLIQMDTRVLESQASQWWRRWQAGAPVPEAPDPILSRPPYYDSVGAGHGVHYSSDFYDVRPHVTYRISADLAVPGHPKGATAKVFVKGYAAIESGANAPRREVWRTYLACRSPDSQWHHYWQCFEPPQQVQWVRIVLYACWPVGIYYWDNVCLSMEPVAAEPQTPP